MKTVAVVLAVAAVVSSGPVRLSSYGLHPRYTPALAYRSPTDPYYNAPAVYSFDWGVSDGFGNDYGHSEDRDGHSTRGSYFVNLPDGRLQKVTYAVDGDSGFVADVSYVGEARYPTYSPGPAYRPTAAYGPGPVYGPLTTYG